MLERLKNQWRSMCLCVKLWIILDIIITFTMVGGLLYACSGCTSFKYTRVEVDANNAPTSYTIIQGREFLMDSDIDNVYVKVTGRTRTFSVGSIDRNPDANAVGAVAEGVASGIVKGVTGL